MAQFEPAYQRTSVYEGGYANVPADQGGETYRGIARNFHPSWPGWVVVDAHKSAIGRPLRRGEFIQDSYLDQLVRSFYYVTFWKRNLLDLVRDQPLAELIYDFLVMTGRAALVLQKTLNDFFSAGLAEDSQIGPKTVAAINRVPARQLYDHYRRARAAYHRARADRVPSQVEFLAGWLARVEKFATYPGGDTSATR